ncbi:serine/threonine-protein kinase pkn1 [mine drainage metagenome]|uniref:Serine/threonine-protein kinase pkn1 n=1 Tax=mine drainage metagenome TaxID=410659 RepID=A0A1J5QW69_9ZZZZ
MKKYKLVFLICMHFYLALFLSQAEARVEQNNKVNIVPLMVRIPGKNYEIGKYEITQAQWQLIMGSNPSKFKKCGENCPVENVSWDDVQIYIHKLNAKSGLQYRLPTEQEWEYACFGGHKSNHCGGNNADAVGWYIHNSNNTTHPVGQKQGNGYGIYDMSGNVFEWVQGTYDNEHNWRVFRGGSWYFDASRMLAIFRNANFSTIRNDNLGFRIARSL